MFVYAILALIIQLSVTAHACQVKQPFFNTKTISDNTAALRIAGPLGWFPSDVSKLGLVFSSPLTLGVDYVYQQHHSFSVPDMYQYKPQQGSVLTLVLLPGRSWITEPCNETCTISLTAVTCDGKSVTPFEKVLVAKVTTRRQKCPHIPHLPDSSESFASFMHDLIKNCQGPKIIPSKQLDWKRFQSITLLRLEPPVLLVDGRDQSMAEAGKAVDKFLAAHAVLDIAWEPFNVDEPQWWVLMPRPPGTRQYSVNVAPYLNES
jgi:hypothetical protein